VSRGRKAVGLFETAWLPKVNDLRNIPIRLTSLTALALIVSLLTPTVAASATSLLSASAAYPSFSPDRDGYRDLLPLRYRLSATSTIWVRVYRGTTLVRTLRNGVTAYAGTHTLTWNGRMGTGAAAPAATYKWVITARKGTTTAQRYGYAKLTRRALPTNRWVGFYVPGAPLGITALASLEAKVGEAAAVSTYFQSTSQGFTSTQATNASDHGAVPLTTLEMWDPAQGVDQPAYRLKAIASGAWDAYLRRYAASAKAFGRPVRLRLFHEMNGNWYPWGGTVNGNTPADFVAAWRHVRSIFTAAGATNVKFVWTPNVESVPNTSANAIAKYWPGEAYVDYIALDGYNFGTSRSWSSWRSFGAIFGPAYTSVTALSPKPMFIAEIGCATVGGDKAAWIADMFRAIPQRYPRIAGVSWFNANKECDWRVESSTSSLASFRAQAVAY